MGKAPKIFIFFTDTDYKAFKLLDLINLSRFLLVADNIKNQPVDNLILNRLIAVF